MQAVRLIAKKSTDVLTEQERSVLAKFHALGCISCHQIRGGEVELTERGKNLSRIHLGCPELMQALSQ